MVNLSAFKVVRKRARWIYYNGCMITSGAARPTSIFRPLPESVFEPSCYTCMIPYNCGEEVCHLPCGHQYHKACVDNKWTDTLKSIQRCPFCSKVFIRSSH